MFIGKKGECTSVVKELELFIAQLRDELDSLAASGCHNTSSRVISQFHGIYIFEFNTNLNSPKISYFLL